MNTLPAEGAHTVVPAQPAARARGLLERRWLQRTVLAFSAFPVVPVAIELIWRDLSPRDLLDGIPELASYALLVGNILLACRIAEKFDPGGRATGYFLKFLAVLHAIAAILVLGAVHAELIDLAYVPQALIWAHVGYCWIIAPLAFLTGDVMVNQLDRRV